MLQLYELTDDPQRKEFLDDLFAFMQKRGEYAFTYSFACAHLHIFASLESFTSILLSFIFVLIDSVVGYNMFRLFVHE